MLNESARYERPVVRDDVAGRWVHPVVKVRSSSFFTRLLTQRNLGVGEAFLAQEFEMLRGSVNHMLGFFQRGDMRVDSRRPWLNRCRHDPPIFAVRS